MTSGYLWVRTNLILQASVLESRRRRENRDDSVLGDSPGIQYGSSLGSLGYKAGLRWNFQTLQTSKASSNPAMEGESCIFASFIVSIDSRRVEVFSGKNKKFQRSSTWFLTIRIGYERWKIEREKGSRAKKRFLKFERNTSSSTSKLQRFETP